MTCQARALYLDLMERTLLGKQSMLGEARMRQLREAAETCITEEIPGDFIETGVWRGGACIMLRAVLKAYGVKDRKVWAADSFCGLPKPQPQYPVDAGDPHHAYRHLAIPLEDVKRNFAQYDLLDDQVVFLPGWFADTLPTAPIERLAILRLDGDMYGSTIEAFGLYDKVSPGGFIIVDDYGAVHGCRAATDHFRRDHNISEPWTVIDYTGLYWRKAA